MPLFSLFITGTFNIKISEEEWNTALIILEILAKKSSKILMFIISIMTDFPSNI